jgi:hypothetical protein
VKFTVRAKLAKATASSGQWDIVKKLLAGKPIFLIIASISFSVSGVRLALAGGILAMIILSYFFCYFIVNERSLYNHE